MSGNQIGSVIGAAVGFVLAPATGGASLIWAANGLAIGGAIGGILMPDQIGIQDQHGPRLSNLKLTKTAYGEPINRVFGSNRVGGNIIWATDILETKHVTEEEVGKGGSETYDVITYSYSISMAIALCEGPLVSVNKIWADSSLIFDASQGGYTQSFLRGEYASGQIEIYFGTDDQRVDWVAQSINPDSPAYRHIAYIRFHNFQLESYGNRVPNITAEVVKAYGGPKKVIWSHELHSLNDGGITTNGDVSGVTRMTVPDVFFFRTNNLQLYANDPIINNYITCFDLDNHNIMTKRFGVDLYPEGTQYVVPLNNTYSDIAVFGYYVGYIHGGTKVIHSFVLSDGTTKSIRFAQEITGSSAFLIFNNYLYLYVNPWPSDDGLEYVHGNIYRFDLDGIFFRGIGAIFDVTIDDPFLDIDNLPFNHADVYTVHIIDTTIHYITSVNDTSPTSRGTIYLYNSISGDFIRTINIPPETTGTSLVGYGINGGTKLYLDNESYYLGSYGLTQIDFDGNYIRTIPPSVLDDDGYSYSIIGAGGHGALTTLINGILTTINSNSIFPPSHPSSGVQFYGIYSTVYDLNAGGKVTLNSIITELAENSEIHPSELDLLDGSAQEVEGFVISEQSSARSAIAELQKIYLFDIYEDNYNLVLKMRGDSPSYTINEYIEGEEKAVSAIRKLDTELPKKITLTYSNSAIDYQIGSQYSMRLSGNSDNNVKIEAPITMSDSEAKQLVEKLMFLTWSGKSTVTFKIPFNSSIKLCDVAYFELDDITYSARISNLTLTTDYIYEGIAITENTGVYISNAEGSDTSSGFIPSASNITGQAQSLIFNGPSLDNSVLDAFGIYIATTGQFIDIWRGCNVYKSKDLEQSYQLQGTIIPSIPIGSANEILSSGDTTVWDLENTINIKLYSDAVLTSSTDEILLSTNTNYIMIGNEVLQFRDATLESNGSYTLSRLLRGRRGTEWAVDNHISNENFVFLTQSIMFNPSTLNTLRHYKSVAFGYYIDATQSIEATYDGTNLNPFAPVSLEVIGEVITWVRRDRYISGYLRTLPNSETQEKYKVELFELGISVFSDDVVNDTTYTYDSVTYPNIDAIQVSQYSDNLMDYGYIAEISI